MVVQNDLDDISQRAWRLYEGLRGQLEPTHDGRFLIINLETGEYELGDSDVAVARAAKARFPTAQLFLMRVGRRAAYRIGFGATSSQ